MSQSIQDRRVTLAIEPSGIATVTLCRPEKHNAFDDQMIELLTQAFRRVEETPEVRALLLKSEGVNFCAGADLAWMRRMAEYTFEENQQDAQALALMLYTLRNLPIPTIVRVQGMAFGGAVGLVSCCDIALASVDAQFGLTEVRIGLIPATIGPYVIEAIGRRWASRLFVTGERFSAQRALEIGLIHECFPGEALDAAVSNLLDEICKNGPQAVVHAKAIVGEVDGLPINEALIEHTSRRIAELRVSPEGQEGLSAFLEKRRPCWPPRTGAGDS
ncbi:MAG: enoyl-CoA hydratase/isomerase family protein [Pseudomonadota bacterium]